jgi:hypothetical protein
MVDRPEFPYYFYRFDRKQFPMPCFFSGWTRANSGKHRVKQVLFRASGDDASQVREVNNQPSACCRPDREAADLKSQTVVLISHYKRHGAGQLRRRMTMSDNGTLFPNILQPAATLKACAPLSVKFWENQETALEGLKEFADGWFARRQKGMQTALEAAKHIGDANTPSDMLREYQNWLRREMELLAEDGKAYQQQMLRAGPHLSAQRAADHPTARPEAPQTDKRRTG